MINQEKDFNLSKKREELSKYLREQGLSVNICGDILRVVTNQDREFIKKLKEEFKSIDNVWYPYVVVEQVVDKLAGKELI